MKPRLTTAQRRALQDAAASPVGLYSPWQECGTFHPTREDQSGRMYQRNTIQSLVRAGLMRLSHPDGSDTATVTDAGRAALAGRVRR